MEEMKYTTFWSETFNRGDIGTKWRILFSSVQFSGFKMNLRDIRYGIIKWFQLQSFEVDNDFVDFKNIVNILTNSVAFQKKSALLNELLHLLGNCLSAYLSD
jgi:hypothetical protein